MNEIISTESFIEKFCTTNENGLVNIWFTRPLNLPSRGEKIAANGFAIAADFHGVTWNRKRHAMLCIAVVLFFIKLLPASCQRFWKTKTLLLPQQGLFLFRRGEKTRTSDPLHPMQNTIIFISFLSILFVLCIYWYTDTLAIT